MASMAAGMARSRTSSSSLTSIRSAWKVRLAGWPPDLAAPAGTTDRIWSTSSPVVVKGFSARAATIPVGDTAGELLLPPFPDDPDEVFLAVIVDDVGGRLAAAGVHPHVQRRVEGVREAAFALIELQEETPRSIRTPGLR